MWLLTGSLVILLCNSPFGLSAIIPQLRYGLYPQRGDIKPGVYRFVNYGTGTALSINDTSADSAVVSMYVSENAGL